MHVNAQPFKEKSHNPSTGPIWDFYHTMPGWRNHTDLYEAVARLIPQTLQAEAGAVALINEADNEIVTPAVWTLNEDIRHHFQTIRLPADKILATDIFRADTPAMDNNLKDNEYGFQPVDPFVFDYATSRVVVPLKKNNKKIGLLWAINKLDGDFSLKDIEALSAIAVVTVLGIEAISMRGIQCRSGQSVEAFNQAKDLAIHHLSHTLKTPIAVLIASISLLEKQLIKLPESGWRKITERAHRNLKRLLSAEYEIEDILRRSDYTPLPHQAAEAGKQSSVDIDSAPCASGESTP